MTARSRIAAALCTLLAALAAGPVRAGASPAAEPLTGPTLVNAMLDLEAKMDENFLPGYAVPVGFADASQTGGPIAASEFGDSGEWTGVYLGGQAMRYVVAKHHLAADGLTPEETAFWTEQRDRALDRVHAIVANEHRDINIAEDWTGELRIPPRVNTTDPTGKHAADFGGGVIHGEKGMIQRSCTPSTQGALGIPAPYQDAANPVNDNSNRVFEITWHEDGVTYYCETSPSRDTYAGLTFGLLTAFDLVGPDDPALQATIRDDIIAMGDFLVKYGWNYPRPHGYVSAKHDFDGFISPLFVYVPMARLNLANAARHVADVAGDDVQKARWDAIWAEEFATQGVGELAGSMVIDSLQPNDGYYKYNLHHLTAFNLLRTTTGVERDVIARSFAIMDATTNDDLNGFFEAITYGLTGDEWRLAASVEHLTQWLDYRANTEAGQWVHNSARCGVDLTCVPNDQYDLEQEPVGTVTWYPGAPEAPPLSKRAGLRATGPLPVAERPPTDFLWQRPPTQLDGAMAASWRYPGIDYLAPYWILRYFTDVVTPAPTPFPAWAGPSFK